MRWLVVCSLLLLGSTAAQANFISDIVEEIINLFQTYEEAPYNVTRTANGYEERLYEARKWVCSRSNSYSDPDMAVLAWRLNHYMTGDHSGQDKVYMGLPVTTEYLQRGPQDKTFTLCFLIDQKHQDDPPTPTNKFVFIEHRLEMRVLTRTVGGYMYHENEWMEEAGKLAAIIQQEGESVSLNHVHWASYDFPWKFWNRRNEVWFPVA
ncbi:heme-binding protein 2-like [Procambarus clarkii]|uniref:heme-binding protein 2-like n=1 Tax=Procambarus clarkii TaxID=6728 RepID=UPI003743333A